MVLSHHAKFQLIINFFRKKAISARLKSSGSEVVRLPPHADFIREIFNTPVPLSEGVESIFSLGIKTFFAQRG